MILDGAMAHGWLPTRTRDVPQFQVWPANCSHQKAAAENKTEQSRLGPSGVWRNCQHAPHLVGSSDVGGQAKRLADRGGRLGEPSLVDVHQGDARARLGQHDGAATAQPRRCAGHEGVLTAQREEGLQV
jgi:hypothetical protein